jgi:superfamily II DNA/RNA helicase
VQWEVIPWLLQEYENSLAGYWPRDLCVSAPTGSGKTLAFALPIIQVDLLILVTATIKTEKLKNQYFFLDSTVSHRV